MPNEAFGPNAASSPAPEQPNGPKANRTEHRTEGAPAVIEPNRRTGHAEATAVRVLKKRRRWADELRTAGWAVEEPAPAQQ